jgi:hypothetical protein
MRPGWAAIRQPGSGLSAWFGERLGTLQGRTRRIANRYFNNGPAFRTTLVSLAPPGDTAYTAMPEGSRRASAAVHQAMMSFASAYALLGTYFTFGPLRIRASTAAVPQA